jgi:hypothetical protein
VGNNITFLAVTYERKTKTIVRFGGGRGIEWQELKMLEFPKQVSKYGFGGGFGYDVFLSAIASSRYCRRNFT